jgi:membrane protein implicated in regulation of membrane protease activity
MLKDMRSDDLKTIWQGINKSELVKTDINSLNSELKGKLQNIDKKIKRRDITEISTAALMILIFGYLAFRYDNILLKVGASVIVAGMLLIIYRLLTSNKKSPDINSTPVIDYLTDRKRYLEKQTRLINSVLYWYILPCYSGMVIMFLGFNTTTIHTTINILFATVVCIVIYIMNKRAVKKDLLPLLKQTEEAINNYKNRDQ